MVRAELRGLKERDDAIERWLREDVAPTYDAMKANPKRGILVADAFASVRARDAMRRKAKA